MKSGGAIGPVADTAAPAADGSIVENDEICEDSLAGFVTSSRPVLEVLSVMYRTVERALSILDPDPCLGACSQLREQPFGEWRSVEGDGGLS